MSIERSVRLSVCQRMFKDTVRDDAFGYVPSENKGDSSGAIVRTDVGRSCQAGVVVSVSQSHPVPSFVSLLNI